MREANIYIVDDDEDDRFFLREAVTAVIDTCNINEYADGHAFKEYLETGGLVKDHGFVFLDVNMPKMNGLEVLEFLKSNEKLKALTIFMTSTSESQQQIELAYNLGVTKYLIKPYSLEDYNRMVANIYQTFIQPLFKQ